MAKQSMIQRENKRAKTVAKYAAKRAALKALIVDQNASDEDRWNAQMALQKQPRNASSSRQRRRCRLPAGLMVFTENLVCAEIS